MIQFVLRRYKYPKLRNQLSFLHLHISETLGGLISVTKTKKDAIRTNQETVLLLNEWPRTTVRRMATAKKFTEFFQLIVLFSLQL